MFRCLKPSGIAIAIGLLATACQPAPEETEENLIHPDKWTLQQPVVIRDSDMEQRISELMAKMTLEEKVGQLIQPDINAVTPGQVREFNLGSVLNGGGSAPDKNLRNTPDSWLALADEFWEASTDTSDGGVGIPVIWGTDAVHGHSNIVGATLFPHNIGLGAANDPDLMYEIGRVTALEVLTTGLDWTFAPTIAVVRNDRWGRTYESYSEDPRIVAAYAPRIVEGIQGTLGTDEFLNEDRILATAKHFVGDGGTYNGVDQGDNRYSEAEIRDIHAAGYLPAIAAGAQTVMASYNSFHGHKLHGMKTMLTDVLVGRMGFDGFVVGDWNGHGQVRGCKNDSCADSFNAGLDMFMVPNDWEGLYHATIKQVKSGEITQQRLDDAVARILRVKIRAGILEAPKPSARKNAGNWALLAAPEHRAIAREAVRKSLVLLKNEDEVLPLAANAKVLVAGDGADNIAKQSGGWTLSWQGTGNSKEHFPNATSIYEGIRETVEAAGGQTVLSQNGQWQEKPDVAIVVFGEDPYAEGVGDRDNVDFDSDEGLGLLKKFREAGIPTISVFISGRALWVNPELNLSNAFVVAWLPGSEGGGIADVLFAGADGQARHDFSGRLSFSWPATAEQVEVNVGDSDYQPLFPYGYGLSYGDSHSVVVFAEDSSDPLEEIRGMEESRVMTKATRYLNESPRTVTADISPRSTGTAHDFYSEGDYWWPDPDHPDGPYIRRDGLTNPDNFVAHRHAMVALSDIVATLTSAYLLTNEQTYAEQAIQHLSAWFIDTETKMNPSLLYGQAIKGRHSGRSIGIIDTIHLVEVARSIEVLESENVIPPKTLVGLKDWFRTYLLWLNQHPYGQRERLHPNNHGVCWSLQAAAFARLIGDKEQLAWIRQQFKDVYLASMMDQTGGFPAELARTKPYGYSLFMIDAMAGVATLASTPEDNLWTYTLPDGRGMELGLAFIAPYIKDKASWTLPPDVLYWDEWPVRQPSLLHGGYILHKPELIKIYKPLEADPTTFEILRNLPIRHPLLWVDLIQALDAVLWETDITALE